MVLRFLPASLYVLAIGISLRWPWSLNAGLAVVPVVAALIVLRFAGRRSTVSGDRFAISSRFAQSSGHLVLDARAADIPKILRAAVVELPRFQLQTVGPDGGELFTRATIRTWGVVIGLRFEPMDAASTRIAASAAPLITPTVVDYGQSRIDLRDLFDALTRCAAKAEP
ncbi:hypothetical protein D6T65_14595 [Arthrobacter frigidicola]|nr:hypothetical protein D6T65_14595 [Arthrobacter frigidicola]